MPETHANSSSTGQHVSDCRITNEGIFLDGVEIPGLYTGDVDVDPMYPDDLETGDLPPVHVVTVRLIVENLEIEPSAHDEARINLRPYDRSLWDCLAETPNGQACVELPGHDGDHVPYEDTSGLGIRLTPKPSP